MIDVVAPPRVIRPSWIECFALPALLALAAVFLARHARRPSA
ncbi:MAG: hypothetical protein ACF8XB_05815 [Planctomycetota bacterium JB042]